jgi:hypothetical protein
MENINTAYQTLPKDESNVAIYGVRSSSPSTPIIPDTNTGKAYIALIASILFTAIISLEITASVAASKGRSVVDNKSAAWCSPIFQSALAVQSGCTIYEAKQDSTKGIGCVNLPAHLQSDWLRATEILVPVALVLQGLDFVILWAVHGSRRVRGIKMKRPWFTVRLFDPSWIKFLFYKHLY